MRIVSLLPSATEILFAIGAGDEVVAVTHECDHPARVEALPRVTRDTLDHRGQPSAAIDRHIQAARHRGSSIYALDEEMLRSLAPDLLVTQELCDVCAVAYSQVAAAVRRLDGEVDVVSLEPRSLDDILTSAQTLGEMTGHCEEALALVDSLRRRLGRVAAMPAPQPTPSVVCIEWTDPLMAGGHWVPEMVRRAGGRDLLGREGRPSHYVGWGEVIAAAPEILVLMPCGHSLDRTVALAPEVTRRPEFASLPCARTGRVLAVDGSSYFNRPGPRIVEGVEILAAAMRAEPGGRLPPGGRWLSEPPSPGSARSACTPSP